MLVNIKSYSSIKLKWSNLFRPQLITKNNWGGEAKEKRFERND